MSANTLETMSGIFTANVDDRFTAVSKLWIVGGLQVHGSLVRCKGIADQLGPCNPFLSETGSEQAGNLSSSTQKGQLTSGANLKSDTYGLG